MTIRIETAVSYQHLSKWLNTIPRAFKTNQGELLYHGRNEVRRFDYQELSIVVKRFKPNGLIKGIVYSFFRKNKAKRAYENATQLIAKGFNTPLPVAYIEERRWKWIGKVYYICLNTDAQPIKPRLIEQEPFDRSLAAAYAGYVAQLHQKGVLHCDLNPTNVLYTQEGEKYRFELIDINRMKFFDSPVPKAECMENLTLFYWLTPAYHFILNEYAHHRNWTDDDIAEAIQVKKRHDKRWIRRKQITHLGRYKACTK